MTYLNLGCGATRPPEPFVNVDMLEEVLESIGADALVALRDLRRETNYVNLDLSLRPWPWADSSVDAVLASHYFEHMDAQAAVATMKECHRILKPGGVLRISVPNASYFREHHARDCRENWMEIFGEGNDGSDKQTYRSVALFFHEHAQVLTEDSLWCEVVEAGFLPENVYRTCAGGFSRDTEASRALAAHDNRALFSLYMEAYA